MKTLSFHDLEIGRSARATLLSLDTSRDGVAFGPGLHLICAPNGYGKTTLFQTLAGVLPSLKGFTRLDGHELDPEREAFYVSEYLHFPKFIYPGEWIEFAAAKPAMSAARWIEEFALVPQMRRYLGRLSQGERRKATWIAAHASQKPLLLLDEPLDGLDLLAIRSARALIEEWKREGRIVCVIAHQVSELLDLSTELYLVRGQRLRRWREEMADVAAPALLAPREFRERVVRYYLTSSSVPECST